MDELSRTSGEEVSMQVDSLPQSLGDGLSVLVACPDTPTHQDVCLRLLSHFGTAEDRALVVTTTVSADQTLVAYERVSDSADRPTLGIVDTLSKQQSISAIYNETSIIYTPSPGDLERLIMALSELSSPRPPATGSRHLVVRSLTPILNDAGTDNVRAALERITGLRSGRGLGLLGLDYTAHSEETLTRLANHVDGVLWTKRSDHELTFEFRPSR